MTSCPSRDEWVRHLDGEVTANRAAELAAHASTCGNCRGETGALDDLAHRLRAPSVPVARVEAVNARVMAAIAAGHQDLEAPSRRRVWYAAGVALAAAAAVAIIAMPRGDHREELQARGGDRALGLDRVAVTIHALDGELRPLEAGTQVTANAAYVASYRNPGAPAFAMVFAIDAERELHWLYPAYTDATTDPISAPIATRPTAALFSETVMLDAPARGAMTFVILVGDEPLHVRDLERLPHGERTVDAVRARWPAASLRAFTVDVH